MFRSFLLLTFAFCLLLSKGKCSVLLTDSPPGFSVKAEVAAVLPFFEDKILLLQRLPTHPQANLWCAPGGKLNRGETPLSAAVRELAEETGIEADPNSLIYLGKFYVRYPNGDFIFHLFQTQLTVYPSPISIRREEHQSYGFYSPEELSALALTPGLDECIEFAIRS